MVQFTFNFENFSSTPPKIMQHIAVAVSAGIPTSHGNQYLDCLPSNCMSHGCTNIPQSTSSAACQRKKWMSDQIEFSDTYKESKIHKASATTISPIKIPTQFIQGKQNMYSNAIAIMTPIAYVQTFAKCSLIPDDHHQRNGQITDRHIRHFNTNVDPGIMCSDIPAPLAEPGRAGLHSLRLSQFLMRSYVPCHKEDTTHYNLSHFFIHSRST